MSALRSTENEGKDAGSYFGEENIQNNDDYYGESHLKGRPKKILCEEQGESEQDLERVRSANLYVGQWDSTKEKMTWGVMEKDRDTFIKEGGFIKATSLGSGYVEGMGLRKEDDGGDKLGVKERNGQRRIKGPIKNLDNAARLRYVGEKRSYSEVREQCTTDKNHVEEEDMMHKGPNGKCARLGVCQY